MSKSLAHVLVEAKKKDKWVPVKCLVKHGLNRVNVIRLEDQSLLLVHRSSNEGMLLKLTAKGYHVFSFLTKGGGIRPPND